MNLIKSLPFILSLLFSLTIKAEVFFPLGEEFKKCDNSELHSLNDIANFLGYGPDMYYTYTDKDLTGNDIITVGLVGFSSNILFVLTKDNTFDLTIQDVNSYMSNFNQKKILSSVDYERRMESIIESGDTVSENNIYRFFDNSIEKIEEGIYFDGRYGYLLSFSNGFLKDFWNGEYINAYTKDFRVEYPKAYTAMYNIAKKYWNDEEKACKELNEQVYYFRHIKFDNLTSFKNVKETDIESNISVLNYKIIYSIQENLNLTIRELKDYTHNQARRVDVNDDSLIGYEYNGILFTFYKEDGTLKSYIHNMGPNGISSHDQGKTPLKEEYLSEWNYAYLNKEAGDVMTLLSQPHENGTVLTLHLRQNGTLGKAIILVLGKNRKTGVKSLTFKFNEKEGEQKTFEVKSKNGTNNTIIIDKYLDEIIDCLSLNNNFEIILTTANKEYKGITYFFNSNQPLKIN